GAAAAVAAALGVPLPFDDPVRAVADVVRATARNRASMLQDVERGRRTEIEDITGAVVRYANACGVPCPENVALLDEVRERTKA
ncbi:MAG: 2-dehydropantoate 2-reductase, partial [Candidatus Eremiobacteraeota bacterium]|nr:2-dehydropantoate 2-reductase [Candidatus Eremiobacteraeota bacterium]